MHNLILDMKTQTLTKGIIQTMNTNVQQLEKVTILQWNVNSLQSHLPLLCLALDEHKYDVVILQESLLNSHLSISNYTAFHKFHTPGTNRGISILVRSDIHAKTSKPFDPCGLETEFQGLTIAFQNLELQVYNIYNPPRNSAKL